MRFTGCNMIHLGVAGGAYTSSGSIGITPYFATNCMNFTNFAAALKFVLIREIVDIIGNVSKAIMLPPPSIPPTEGGIDSIRIKLNVTA